MAQVRCLARYAQKRVWCVRESHLRMADEVSAESFGQLLERLMQGRGLNQAQLARELGTWDGNIRRWRNGSGIEIDNVRRIADFFGVDRGTLERLAGYGDSQDSIAKDRVDAEREAWGAWYQHLIDSRVPRRMWEAYTRACEALADVFSSTPPTTLSTDAIESGDQQEDGPEPRLTSSSQPEPPSYPPARPDWFRSSLFAAGAD